jgi:hypothetical protein
MLFGTSKCPMQLCGFTATHTLGLFTLNFRATFALFIVRDVHVVSFVVLLLFGTETATTQLFPSYLLVGVLSGSS